VKHALVFGRQRLIGDVHRRSGSVPNSIRYDAKHDQDRTQEGDHLGRSDFIVGAPFDPPSDAYGHYNSGRREHGLPPHPVVRNHRQNDIGGSAGVGNASRSACVCHASRCDLMSSSAALSSPNRCSACASLMRVSASACACCGTAMGVA
jgi:hypothetical protein